MRRALCVIAMVCASIGVAQTYEEDESSASGCGVERWAVKELSDAAASTVTMTPVDRTVWQLRMLDTIVPQFNDARRPDETTLYRVLCLLKGFKLENDGDIHLIIADTTHHSYTMIAEIPDSSCPDAIAGGHAHDFADARRALLGMASAQGFQLDTLFQWFSPMPLISISGVGYYDPPHGQAGKAPDNLELHPVLAIAPAGPSIVEEGNTPHSPLLEVYPQPAVTTLFVGVPAGTRQALLVNMLGEQCGEWTDTDGTRTITIDCATLPAGVYALITRYPGLRALVHVVH